MGQQVRLSGINAGQMTWVLCVQEAGKLYVKTKVTYKGMINSKLLNAVKVFNYFNHSSLVIFFF